jgi:RHS repeat-associated protein
VIAELDDNNNMTTSRQYDVYGAPRAGTQQGVTASSSQGYVGSLGHVTDQSTGGLIYMQARYYDPGMGRFISEDPKGYVNNWFVYCSDNPINNVDPEGKTLTPLGNALALLALVLGLTALTIGLILALIAAPEVLPAIAAFVSVCAACSDGVGAVGALAAAVAGTASFILGNQALLAIACFITGAVSAIIGYELTVNDALTEPDDAPPCSNSEEDT